MKLIKTLLVSLSIIALAACDKSGAKTEAAPSTPPKSSSAVTYTPEMFKTDGLTIVAGQDYKLIANPQPVAAGTTEVTELFWYGCPHCFRLEPALKAWKSTLPADVKFTRYHVDLGGQTGIHQKMYFAIKALNKNEELDPKVFDALAFNPQAFNDAAAAKTFGTSNGIDAATWDKAYGGFDSNANIAAVKGMVESFGIEGVPAIIVNGKYLVGGESVRTLQVVNKLIEMDKAAAPK